MRRSIIFLTTVVVTATVGPGLLLAGDAVSFEATPATVSDESQTAAGYELQRRNDQRVAREFGLFGQDVRVTVTNRLVRYDRSIAGDGHRPRRAATFVTLATPEVRLAFRSFNPVARMSNDELAGQFDDAYRRLNVSDWQANRTVDVLGAETVLDRYDGRARADGDWVDVAVHVTKVQHDGDYVVVLGVYPVGADGERERLLTMLDGLEHGDGPAYRVRSSAANR